MKRNIGIGLSAVLITMALAASASAQTAGFRTAGLPAPQPQPQVATPVVSNPVQPFITAPMQRVGTYGVMPAIVLPIISTSYSPIYSNFPTPVQSPNTINSRNFGQFPNGVTIFMPNGTVIANTVIVNQPQSPVQPFTSSPVSNNAMSGRATAQLAVAALPNLGVPRNQILQTYGNPLTTVITQNGEMLYFPGGVTILIQNGTVAAAQRTN